MFRKVYKHKRFIRGINNSANRYNVPIVVSNTLYIIKLCIGGIYSSEPIKAFVTEAVIQKEIQLR